MEPESTVCMATGIAATKSTVALFRRDPALSTLEFCLVLCYCVRYCVVFGLFCAVFAGQQA